MTDSDYIKNIIFLRTDSIGDNIIAMSTLPFIREKFPEAEITVVCQDHIRPLYETCPHIDQILTFNREKYYQDLKNFTDHSYADNINRQIKALKADLLINTVYSREELTEQLVVQAEAKQTVGFAGDFCNITEEVWKKFKPVYTGLVETREGIEPEVVRLEKFLKFLDIDSPVLSPKIWLSDEDEDYGIKVFQENNFKPESTITIFLSSRDQHRNYDKFVNALAPVCRDKNLNVIALGGESDFKLHQSALEKFGSNILNLCGITVRQSAAVIKRAVLNAGVETVFAQVACAVESPNFIVLGGGFFGRFLPCAKFTSVVCLPLECYGCNFFCKYNIAHCTNGISELVVSRAFSRVLEENSEKLRIFVQDQSLWFPKYNEPKWQNFDKFINTAGMEIINIDSAAIIQEAALPADVTGILGEIRELVQLKKLKLANLAMKGLIQDYPGNFELLGLHGEIAFEMGDYKQAGSIFNKLVKLNKKNAVFLHKMAIILWNTGNVFQALNYFKNALLNSPNDLNIQLNYAEAFYQLGAFDKTKDLLFNHLKIDPENTVVSNILIDKLVSQVKENLEKRESENEDKYLVSAIVSVYNAERFIKGLVHDLESQTIASQVEIIMVNSNSPQNEDKLIREYLEKYPNIKYIRTKERETVYQAWNRAIKLASGKYITNANTDDRHRQDAFAVMVNELETYPYLSLVYAPVKITEKENENFSQFTESGSFIWLDWNRELLLSKGCFMGPQPMWKRKLHEEYGYFDGSSVTSGDYEFWLRVSQTNYFKKIPDFLGLYLKSPASIEHTNRDTGLIENNKYLKEYHDADAKGEIIKRLKKLPELSFETAVVPENVLPADTSGFRDMDFFIDYKWNPNANIGKNGYYILAHKWEAYSLPASWIEPLNKKPDEIWVPSAFVRDSYINSGIIEDKVKIIPTGIDIKKFSPEVKPWKINTKKGFKFLFVGSLTERKGIDILLSAFGEEFSDEEDVCLVVRDDMTDVTERNEEIREKINSLNSVIYYGEELEDLPGLYTGADCFVYPFKAEGFGIHVLEAMSSQLPVIVTNGGGPLDYCNHGNSYLLNAEWVDTEDNMNEMHELVDNVYRFEPDKEHLKKLMRQVIKDKREADDKAKKARKTVVKNYSWEAVLEKVNNTLASLKRKPVLRFNPYQEKE